MQNQLPVTETSSDAAVCQQPECALRKEGLDASQLADVILDVLTGKEASPVLASGAITRRDLCRDCVQSIFDGQPLPQTAVEAEHAAQLAEARLRRRVQRTRRRL
jgi:hypothetical protein